MKANPTSPVPTKTIPPARAKKLTPPQAELLAAMQSGVICFFMPYMGRVNPNPYYFRDDTHRHCTAQVKALLDRGLAEEFDREKYSANHKVRAKAIGASA